MHMHAPSHPAETLLPTRPQNAGREIDEASNKVKTGRQGHSTGATVLMDMGERAKMHTASNSRHPWPWAHAEATTVT